ncbi:MAG TPA: hypothetical protein VKA60_24215 [Blastocatellia bacterium]|nr:hypothetical protein [Blastocatellia bacterium]
MKTTLRRGEKVDIIITILDRYYHPVTNDKDRWIELRADSVYESPRASGTFENRDILIRAGETEGKVTFTAKSSGLLKIKADDKTDDGDLDDGKTYVTISRSSQAPKPPPEPQFFSFAPIAYFQESAETEPCPDPIAKNGIKLLYDECGEVEANGAKRAELQLSLTPAPVSEVKVKVSTNPKCFLSYNCGDNPQQRPVEVVFKAGDELSEPVCISSKRPNEVTVTAKVLPNGPETHVKVKFVPPKPVEILFEGEEEVPVDHPIAPLKISLKDADGEAITSLVGDWSINLETFPADPKIAEFDPPGIELSKDRPSADLFLKVKDFSDTRPITLIARHNKLYATKSLLIHGASFLLLAVFAGLGGILGGMARDLYKAGVRYILPKKVRGQWVPGLVGNIVFSIFFGIFCLQLGKLGIYKTPIDNYIAATPTFAFCMGVVGGYGGIIILDWALHRLFPPKPTPPAPADGQLLPDARANG